MLSRQLIGCSKEWMILVLLLLLLSEFFTMKIGLDEPLAAVKKSQKNNGIFISEEHIQIVAGMGFTENQAKIALSKTVI